MKVIKGWYDVTLGIDDIFITDAMIFMNDEQKFQFVYSDQIGHCFESYAENPLLTHWYNFEEMRSSSVPIFANYRQKICSVFARIKDFEPDWEDPGCSSNPKPMNNDGRDFCWKCKGPTRRINTGFFNSDMRYCPECEG